MFQISLTQIFLFVIVSYFFIVLGVIALIFDQQRRHIKVFLLSLVCIKSKDHNSKKLDPDEKAKFDAAFNKDECPICLNEYEGDVNKILSACGHVTCASCTILLLNNSQASFGRSFFIKCPICRTKINLLLYKEIKPIQGSNQTK